MGFKDNGKEEKNAATWENWSKVAVFAIEPPPQENKYGGIDHAKHRTGLGVDYLVVRDGSLNAITRRKQTVAIRGQ